MRYRALGVLLFVALTLALLLIHVIVAAQPGAVPVVEISGNIDEGKVYLVRRALSVATSGNLVLVIDSYGGYVKSMDEIISLLKTSKSKTIVFVPPGAKAVSAAAIIALAANRLYLGEGSIIGACKPLPSDEKTEAYMYSRIKGLLEEKNIRNPDFIARELVFESKAFTAREALEIGLADGSAEDLRGVLKAEGIEGVPTTYIAEDLISEILSLLIDPGVALLLAVLGVLLLALEFHVTGFQGWGILGALFLLTSLYTFNLIGVNLFAFLLMSTGIVLVLLELFKPGVQIMGISGAFLIVLAIIVEYYSQPYLSLSSLTITALIILGLIALFIGFIIFKASETLRMKTLSLEERLVGKTGYAKTNILPGKRGVVLVESEEWTAESDEEIREGEEIVVTAIKGLILRVKRVNR